MGIIFGRGFPQQSRVSRDYQRAFKTLYELAKVENGHAHRWRDTFAVEIAARWVSLSDVSVLLGHQSIKVTEKHYSLGLRLARPIEATVRAAQQRYNSETRANKHQ